jgi:Flp pilus assembly protein TadD
VAADLAAYRRALSRDPANPDLLHDTGLSHSVTGDQARALLWLDRFLRLSPRDPLGWHNRGEVLARRGADAEALAAYDRALGLAPDLVGARLGRANMLQRLGRFAEAAAALRTALAIGPAQAPALNNLGNALRSLQHAASALPLYERALAIDAAYVQPRWNRGLARLALGDFRQGFEDYEARWILPGWPGLDSSRPAWDGSSAGHLLVRSEQGFGDVLQFARFLPPARQRVGRLTLSAPPELLSLLRASFPDVDVETTPDLSAVDRQIPIMSLPRVLGTDLAPPVMLRASEAARRRQGAWRAAIEAEAGLRVGICWSGAGRGHDPDGAAIDRRRSVPVEALAPLAAVPAARIFSLQIGCAAPAWMQDSAQTLSDFDDTAALVERLDAVVTVDTAVAHLAAGLGRPVLLLSRPDACWRWMERRTDSPWYPSVRLYRPARAFDWTETIVRVAADLAAMKEQR